MITKDIIKIFFKKKIKGPVSFRDISLQLNLTPPERRKLKRFLRELVRDGIILRTRKGLYIPSDEISFVTGYFEAHRDGYGFVISEKPGERDIFIPARATLGAMDNDRVIARIENRHKREGSIVRILERVHTKILGTFEELRTGCFVKPKNKSIPFDLYIAPSEKGMAKDGDIVIAEIIDYPVDKRPPAARITKVLKKPENPLDEVELIIDEFNLPRKFPHNVVEEAKYLYHKSPQIEDKINFRKDLRDLITVTIDGENARDFDDAISIRKTEDCYTLWVHIADVSHYVEFDSYIDKEARKRGTSVYFPDRVIPMLPKELSEDLCSLKPKVDRLAFTVEIDFDRKGRRIGSKFYPSIINSNERMTYTSVKKILIDLDPNERKKYNHLLYSLELMGELCSILRENRLKRGSLDFDLPEPEVILDIRGNPEAIIKAERYFSHMIIEEFMIAANEAVATYLESLNIPSIYRIHEKPDPSKLEEIMGMISSLGVFKGKTIRPKDFSHLLRQIQGIQEKEIINYIILRSLKQAKYSTENIGHFGLASESYTHFTSPIRRYPDLVVHRILKNSLNKGRQNDKRIKDLNSILPDIAFHSSRMERQADDAERAVLNAMRVWFMKDKIGDNFEGKVVSVAPYGLKIRLNDYYVEGFLHVSYMIDDFYLYDEKTMSLVGRHKKKRYSIGSLLNVRIDRVDLEEREIIFGLL